MKKKRFDKVKVVKEMARERVGRVKSTKVIKSKKDKYTYEDYCRENLEQIH